MPTNYPSSADNLGQVPVAPFLQSQTVNGRTHRGILNALMAWADIAQARIGFGPTVTPTEGTVLMGTSTAGQVDRVLASKQIYYEFVSVAKPVISFTIPQIYSSLRIDIAARCDVAATASQIYMRFNNDSANNYDALVIYSLGGTMASVELIGQAMGRIGLCTAASSAANEFAHTTINIPHYRITNYTRKAHARSCMVYASGAGGTMEESDMVSWRNFTAATSIQLLPAGGNFVPFTTVAVWADP